MSEVEGPTSAKRSFKYTHLPISLCVPWGGGALGMPPFQKSAVFLNIVQKAFDPPPFYLNICPILQGVFFNNVERDMKYM